MYFTVGTAAGIGGLLLLLTVIISIVFVSKQGRRKGSINVLSTYCVASTANHPQNDHFPLPLNENVEIFIEDGEYEDDEDDEFIAV